MQEAEKLNRILGGRDAEGGMFCWRVQEVFRGWRPALGGSSIVGIRERLPVKAESGLGDVKHLPNKEPQGSHLHLHLEAIVGLSGHRPPTPSLPLAYGHLQSFLTTVFYLSITHVRRSSP